MGKTAISMAIFNRYVGVITRFIGDLPIKNGDCP